MRNKTTRIITGGVVSLAAVAVVGGATGGFASASAMTDWPMHMQMNMGGRGADMNNDNDWQTYDQQSDMTRKAFDTRVKNALNMAYSQMNGQNVQPLYTFNDSYKQAWATYDNSMNKAHDMYMQHQNMQGDQARNDYNDASNKAMSQFMNDMDSAKNKLSGQMDQAGMASSKDMFMNQFNSAKDMYGHMMNQYKSDLYDTL